MSDIETITDFVYNNQRLLLKTSKFYEHLPYISWQTGGELEWIDWPKDDLEKQTQFIRNIAKKRFYHWVKSCPIDQNTKSIIDVGSGLSKSNLLMSQLRPDIDFYLLDKTVDILTVENVKKSKNNYFSKSLDDDCYHGFYNSFDITKDIIKNSPVNIEKIHFLDTLDEWPGLVDVVVSVFSWMWHYHKDIYWSRLLKSLKIGGHLAVTITLRNGERTIEEISNDLGSYPCKIISWPITSPEFLEFLKLNDSPGFDQITHTGYYVWQRLR
jgi:SAM-dependent methyltransferase